MATKRKPLLQRKEQPEKPAGFKVKKLPNGLRPASLPDAIVGDAWTCSKGDEVVVTRRQNGRMTSSVHTVGTDDKSYIELWDDEYHKWFVFSVAEAVSTKLSVKVLRRFQATPSSEETASLSRDAEIASSTACATEDEIHSST